MTSSRKLYLALQLSMLLPWMGCRGHIPVHEEITPPTQAPSPPPPPVLNPLESHLQGMWENTEKAGAPKHLLFGANGTLIFQGGLEFYNPGQWILDAAHEELKITLPNADVDHLQVFQMAVGDGIKAFNPKLKQITYHFDNQTWSLNVAGWTYSKADTTIIKAAPQPPLE